MEEVSSGKDNINCVASFPNAEEFIESFRYINTDVVLMDIGDKVQKHQKKFF